MATTECGVTDPGIADSGVDSSVTLPPTPLVPKGRRRRTSLRPLSTGAYFPVEPLEPPKPLSRSARWLRAALRATPVVAVAVVVARWFEPGRFLAAGDTPPFVLGNTRSDLWWTWSHQISGTGSSSYPMARVLEAGAAAAGDAAGLAAPTVQMLTAVAAALYALWAVASFSGRFLRPMAATLAGVVAVINPYVLAVLPDLRALVLAGLAASLAGLVWDIASGRGVAPLVLVLATVPVSLIAGAPLLLAALGLWLLANVGAAIAVGRLAATKRLLRCGIWAGPLLVLVQLWWLVPAAQAFSPRREGLELTPHLDTSLLVAAAVLVPAGALAAATALDRLWRRAEARRRSGARSWRKLCAAVIVAAAVVALLAPPLPLWTGKTGTPAPQLPTSWETTATAINTSPIRGRALVLPLTPTGRVATTWSYRGVDEVPRQLLTRPVLQHAPAGTLRPAAAVDRHVAAVARRLAAGDTAAATAGLDELGVSHIVVRRDLVASADAPDLAPTVSRLRGWRPVAHADVADVYERVRTAPLVRALPATPTAGAPTVTWRSIDTAHYTVTVDAASGPFVLALGETYGPGWQLSGLPEGWTARHAVVDGYANGWLVDGTGPAHLRLTHRPSDTARIAAYISAAIATVVAALTLALWASRRLKVAAKTQQTQA